MNVIKFLRCWKKSAALIFESVMSYKSAFFMLLISLFLGDILIPVVSAIIYTVSAGIPGWSLAEFVFFQGTLILVMGLWHTFFADFLGITISEVQEGGFDKILLRPFSSLGIISLYALDPDGLAEVAAGLIIVGWALARLHFFGPMLLIYLLIVLLAVLFEFALTIVASSFAFIFTKTWRLFELISVAEKYSRYPLDVYGAGMRFFLTFIVPAAIAAYYPASILLGKQSLAMVGWIAIPVIIFFMFSLWLWQFAMKRYTSAGG